MLSKRHSDHNARLQGLDIEISWTLFLHGTMMLFVFAILFPYAYFKSESRPYLLIIPWSIFNIGYILGHLVSYSPVDTHFHRTYQIYLLISVNVALSGRYVIRFIKKNIPKLNPSKYFNSFWNFFTPFTLFMLSVPQLISGLTALFAIECVQNENIVNSIGHMAPALPVLYLILWSLFQSFGLGKIPHLSLEKIVSWVYAIGGSIITFIFIGSKLNTLGGIQHLSMGIFLAISGFLSLFFEYRLPKDINPIIWMATSALGISMYYHHQVSDIAIAVHKLCGVSALLGSFIRIVQQYGKLTEQIKRLSELFFLLSVTFFLAGMEACVRRAEEIGLDISAYASMVVAITLLLYTYFIMLAYVLSSGSSSAVDLSSDNGRIFKNDEVLYDRVGSSEFYDVQLYDSLARNPSTLTIH